MQTPRKNAPVTCKGCGNTYADAFEFAIHVCEPKK